MHAELKAVVELARQAGAIAIAERSRITPEFKADGTIVTSADRKVEIMLREELPKIVAGAGIWGEEFGQSPAGPAGLWTIDPIDGTTNYAFGSPLWGVGIALVTKTGVQLGVIFLPDLDEMYAGGIDLGVTRNDLPLPLIPHGQIQHYHPVSYDEGVLDVIPRIPGKMRLSGAAVIDGAFTACQRYRGHIGINERLYDIAPGMALCTELDADVRYLDGAPIDYAALQKGGKIENAWIAFPKDSGFGLQ